MMENFLRVFGLKPDTQATEEKTQEGEPIPSPDNEPVSEKLVRRKHRVTGHLENIYRAQGRLEELQNPSWIPLPKDVRRGGVASMQILLGLAAVPSGVLLRTTLGSIPGSILSYLGAQSLMKGIMTFVHGEMPVSRGAIEKRQGKKKGVRGAVSKELVSEASLREKMAEITEATKARQKEFKEYRKKYSAAKEFISPEEHSKAREKFLAGYGEHLDGILDGQTALLEGEPTTGGLNELSKTMEAYYKGLVAPHHEHRDAIGTVAAVGVLTGANYATGGSPVSLETVTALSVGAVQLFLEHIERGEKNITAQEQFEAILREIELLREDKLKAALTLDRLIQRRLKKESEDVGGAHTGQANAEIVRAPERPQAATVAELAEDDQRAVDEILGQWRATVQGIIQRIPQESSISEPVSAAAVSHRSVQGGTLDGFIRYVSSTLATPDQPRPMSELGRGMVIAPPTFYELEHHVHRATIRQRIIGDIMKLVHQDPSLGDSDIKDSNFLEDFIKVDVKTGVVADETGQDISDEALDGIVTYLKNLQGTMNRNSPQGTINKFFGADFFARLESVRDRLEKALAEREIKEAQSMLIAHGPKEILAYLLNRFHIAELTHQESATMSEAVFESKLQKWKERGASREAQDALSMFILRCQQALPLLHGLDERYKDKEDVLDRAKNILRRVPEMDFPDPKQAEQRRVALRSLLDEYLRERKVRMLTNPETVADRLALFWKKDFIAPKKSGPSEDEINVIRFGAKGPNGEQGEFADNRYCSVDTRLIVGSSLSRQNWIGKDEQDILRRASVVHDNPNVKNVEDLFFDPEHKHQERILLWRLRGPVGDIYLVRQGIEYVIAASAAGFSRVPARVYEVRTGNKTYPFTFRLNSKYDLPRLALLKRLKKARLIDGDLPTVADIDSISDAKPIVIHVTAHVVPWLLWFSKSIPSLCRKYDEIYEGALSSIRTVDGKPIPSDAMAALMSDPSFQSYFMKQEEYGTA